MAFRRIKPLGNQAQKIAGKEGSINKAPTSSCQKVLEKVLEKTYESNTPPKLSSKVAPEGSVLKTPERRVASLRGKKLKLPKVPRCTLTFNNYVSALDYDCPVLQSFSIKRLRALTRPLGDAQVPMHILKFKANYDFIGAVVFSGTLLDAILDHHISNDFPMLEPVFQRAIIEEVRIRVLAQYPYLQDLLFDNQIQPFDEYLQKIGKKIFKARVLSVVFNLGQTAHQVYLVLNQAVFTKVQNALCGLPRLTMLDVPKKQLLYHADFLVSELYFSREEVAAIEVGSVLFVTAPKGNRYLKLITTQGIWHGSFQTKNTIKLEGFSGMTERNGVGTARPAVEISIALGSKQVSFEELEKFSPGLIIDSGNVLDKHFPLMANNVQVGTCALVDIEGNLGFEVVGIDKSLLKP